MHFYVDSHSFVPVERQIQEQVKVALLLGRLKEGDKLPSIRDLERELHVGRNIVWRAYHKLRQAGLIRLQQGKGVLVSRGSRWRPQNQYSRRSERLAESILQQVEREGFLPWSFAHFLLARAAQRQARRPDILFVEDSFTLASGYAKQLSPLWRVNIQPLKLDDLGRVRTKRIRAVITTYYTYDQVRRQLHGRKVPIIPVHVTWAEPIAEEINGLRPGARVLFLFKPEDFVRFGNLFARELQARFRRKGIRVSSRPLRSVSELRKLSRGRSYALIYVGTRIWDELSEELRRLPRISRPRHVVEPKSIERAKMFLGIVE